MKLKWYHRKRLIRLADKLEGKGPYATVGPVPAHKFDMGPMFSEIRGGPDIGYADFDSKHCKTAACAFGWAKSDLWFRKAGIRRNGPFDTDFFGVGWGWDYLFYAGEYSAGRKVRASTVAARLRKVAARP